MRSMTGFGRAEAELDGKKITIELKTVNHRFLDINIRMPRTLGFAEEGIRKTIKQQLSRGRVDVFVNYSALGNDDKTASADLALIRSYVGAARAAAHEIGITDDLALSHVIRIPDAIVVQEEKADEEQLTSLVIGALKQALDSLTGMRTREGKELADNIYECLDSLKEISAGVDTKKDTVSREYAEKLKLRLQDLMDGEQIDETRFNSEIAYIADKADITEEIVRLNTHINQFAQIAKKNIAIGRKLDFIVQEMNRELNTIGSKSSDMDITNAVIDGKSIVEKIREQVQNIE